MKSLKVIPRKMCAVCLKRRRTFSPFFDCTGRRCAFCVPKIACQAQNSIVLTTMLLYGKVVSGNVHLARYCAPPRSVGVRRCGRIRQRAGKRADIRGCACGKNCVGEDMRGKGRYRRERARGAGRKNGKKRSLSETRACKRSRRASFRLIFVIRPV